MTKLKLCLKSIVSTHVVVLVCDCFFDTQLRGLLLFDDRYLQKLPLEIVKDNRKHKRKLYEMLTGRVAKKSITKV